MIRFNILKKFSYWQEFYIDLLTCIGSICLSSGVFWLCNNINFTLYISYGLIIALFCLLHVFLIKNRNFIFNHLGSAQQNTNRCKHSTLKLALQIIGLQLQIFLITNWLLKNFLLHNQLNHTLLNISENIIVPEKFITITNSIITWIIFVGILLSISIYKYYFQASSLVIAKFLIPRANNQFLAFLYNTILGIEFHIRSAGMHLLLIIITVNLFQYYTNLYKLKNFFTNPLLNSFLIFMTLGYLHTSIKKLLHYFCKKTNLGLVNIVLLSLALITVSVFIIVQCLLYHLDHLKMIGAITPPTNLIKNLFNNYCNNPRNIKILLIGLSLAINFSLITNTLIAAVENFKITTIYSICCILPLGSLIMSWKFNLFQKLDVLHSDPHASFIVLLMIIPLLNYYYRKIHHFFCYFRIKIIQDHSRKSRNKFELIIYRFIIMYFIYLACYYTFGWIFLVYFLSTGILLSLPIIIILLSKILWLTKN